MLTLLLIETMCLIAMNVWGVSGIIIIVNKYSSFKFPDILINTARTYYHEIKVFYPVIMVIKAGCTMSLHEWDNPQSAIGFFLDLACWWYIRDFDKDDEDRWKRRKDKALEKVSRLGSRLVVQPISATN